jgi:hypothetical protein
MEKLKMKRIIILSSCVLVVVMFLSFPFNIANSYTVVDTGPANFWRMGNSISDTQTVAGQFIVEQKCFVTEIYGWIFLSTHFDKHNLHIVLYEDDNGLPGKIIASKWISTYFTSDDPQWFGISKINAMLTPGVYWVGFRSDANTIMGMPYNSINPLDSYAVHNPREGWYYITGNYNSGVGVRIYGREIPPVR